MLRILDQVIECPTDARIISEAADRIDPDVETEN